MNVLRANSTFNVSMSGDIWFQTNHSDICVCNSTGPPARVELSIELVHWDRIRSSETIGWQLHYFQWNALNTPSTLKNLTADAGTFVVPGGAVESGWYNVTVFNNWPSRTVGERNTANDSIVDPIAIPIQGMLVGRCLRFHEALSTCVCVCVCVCVSPRSFSMDTLRVLSALMINALFYCMIFLLSLCACRLFT